MQRVLDTRAGGKLRYLTLARRTLVSTNVRRVVEAAAPKPILFFPARHDHWLVQTGDGYAAHIAGAIGVLGMFLLTQLGVNTPTWVVVVDMFVLGVGIGSVLPVLTVVVANAFPYKLMGMVDATQQFVRSLGGIIATPLLGTVLVNAFTNNFSNQLSAPLKQALTSLPSSQQQTMLDPQGLINAASQTAIKSQFSAFGQQGQALYQQFINAIHQALATGITHLFTLAMAFMILAILSALILPEQRLQQDEFYES